MVTASFTCARLFQDWPRRSWKLASLTVNRSGSLSEIQSSKTQWTKLIWKRGRHLLYLLRAFLATIRPETTQNVSTTLWLFSETWAATWTLRNTIYCHIWTGFLRTCVQWVTNRGEISSGPERDWDLLSGSLRRSHDGWQLLESEERPLCHWAFQEFEETEV